jgi:hypothetical protein
MGKVGEKMNNEIINESSDNSLQKMKFYVAPEGYDIHNQDTYRVCDIDSDELEKCIANAVRYLSGASVEARIHDNGDSDYVFEASIGTWLKHKKDKIVLYMVKPGDYMFSGKEKASALHKHKESHVYRASSDKLKIFKKMDLEQCLKKYNSFLYCIPHPQNEDQLYPFRTFNELEKIKNMKFSNESVESMTALEQAILEEQISAERRSGNKSYFNSNKTSLNIYNTASKEYKRNKRNLPENFVKSRKDSESQTHQLELEKQMKDKNKKKFGSDGTLKDHYEAKKSLRKDGSLKSKLDFNDFKATKHDKNATIDYAIDDYHKNTINPNNLHKRHMTDEQKKKAEERLKHDAENKKQTRKGSGHNIAILSQKYKTTNKIAKGAVNGFTKSAEKAAQAQMSAKSPKDYIRVAAQQYYDQRMPLPDSARNYIKKKLASRIHNKAYKKRITTGHETMGLAGIGGPIGTTNAIFVSKLQSPTMLRPQYCIQDDMITDNIITTDNDGVLRKVSSDYLEDKNVRMFKYMGKDPNKRLMTILNSVDTEVPREFIYETISDKYLLDDNQIEFDEAFQEVNFNEMRAMIENDAYSVLNKFIYLANPELAKRYTQISNQESSDLLEGHSSDIVIMEDKDMGYFAMNKKSLRRSRFFENVEDIEIYDDLEE